MIKKRFERRSSFRKLFVGKVIAFIAIFIGAISCLGSGPDVVVRFGMISDIHYADFARGRRPKNRASMAKMQECIKTMNQKRLDFIIEIGDYIGNGSPSRKDFLKWLKLLEDEYAKFMGPRYHVLGNHDSVPLDKHEFMKNVVNTGISKDKTYYSFIIKGIQVIVLDCNFRQDATPYGNGKDFDCGVPLVSPLEVKWLKKTLADYNGKSIVFLHYLIHGDVDRTFLVNTEEINKILVDSGKVLAVFSGHKHDGGYAKVDGIHHYVLKSMIEKAGYKYTSYAVVEIRSDNSIKITGFGRTKNQFLK